MKKRDEMTVRNLTIVGGICVCTKSDFPIADSVFPVNKVKSRLPMANATPLRSLDKQRLYELTEVSGF